MNKTAYWGLAVVMCLVLSAIYFSLVVGVWYPMKAHNCDDIMVRRYDVATEDVSNCIKFRNYPFWNFYFVWIILWVILQIIYWMIFIALYTFVVDDIYY